MIVGIKAVLMKKANIQRDFSGPADIKKSYGQSRIFNKLFVQCLFTVFVYSVCLQCLLGNKARSVFGWKRTQSMALNFLPMLAWAKYGWL
jgi:hypothetical protein